MTNEDRKAHWERVYESRRPDQLSWYQPAPTLSLELIRATGAPRTSPILDVGGGASTLVDHLVAEGYSDVSVLDISSAALNQARARLGNAATKVKWIEADILDFKPERPVRVWHDRAVFHFLTDAKDRSRYLETLRSSLNRGGHLILATFGPEGPARCSGLPVQRYGESELSALLGSDLCLKRKQMEKHKTPSGGNQEFFHGWWEFFPQD